jgi:hypothetical protein
MLPENWQALPYLTIQDTAALFGCSRAAVYKQLRAGTLSAVCIAGRTLIRSTDIIRTLNEAPPWRPDHKRVAAAAAAQVRPPRRERSKMAREQGKHRAKAQSPSQLDERNHRLT